MITAHADVPDAASAAEKFFEAKLEFEIDVMDVANAPRACSCW